MIHLKKEEIFSELDKLSQERQVIIITDTNVYKYYLKDTKYDVIYFESGENYKTLDTVNFIYDELILKKATRNTLLVGFGGGIVTDVTGYVASTYLRGVEFIFVSTTLLGMVDAAIGGKNGVNFQCFKNLIGTFSKPKEVYYSVDFLDTLPEKELHAGFGEILKYAIGLDEELFSILEDSNYEDIVTDDSLLEKVIRICISIKERIVENDFKESGQRKLLNLGHTIGHAIEKSTRRFVHGEAVGIGLFVIAYLSAYLNKIEYEQLIRIINLIDKFHFCIPIPEYKEVLKCIKYIELDKKRNDLENIDLILINGIGSSEIVNLNKEKIIKDISTIFLIS